MLMKVTVTVVTGILLGFAAEHSITDTGQPEALDILLQEINKTEGVHNSTENGGSFNVTEPMDPQTSEYNRTARVNCFINNTDFVPVVEVQPNITSLRNPATCIVVLFYSPTCPFSCMAAPHYNALPRVFPDIRMAAVDTSLRHSYNAQYGIVGLPSLLIFHNGRPAARFNSSSEFTLEAFAKFISNNTGVGAEGKLFVTSVDFTGPISSVLVKQVDYCLVLSWLFILLCCMYCCMYFAIYSWWCQWLIDAVRSAWREAEAQHQHSD